MGLFPEVDREVEEIIQWRKIILEGKLNELRSKGYPWQPSNGTEEAIFEEDYCANCSKDDVEKEKFCKILEELRNGGTHKDLRCINGVIYCLQEDEFLEDMKSEIVKEIQSKE